MNKIITIISVLLVAGTSFAGVTWKVGVSDGEVWTDDSGNLTAEGVVTSESVSVTGAITAGGAITASGALSGGVSVTSGTGSVSTVTATDSDYGNMKKTTLVLSDTVLKTVSATGTNAWGGVKLYDFPAGRILVHGVIVDNLIIAPQTNMLPIAGGGDWAIGTVVATTNALSGTMVDLCPSTSADPINGTNDSALASSAQFDGTATAKDMFLNLGIDIDDHVIGTATNTVDGTVTIHWTNLGDY